MWSGKDLKTFKNFDYVVEMNERKTSVEMKRRGETRWFGLESRQ